MPADDLSLHPDNRVAVDMGDGSGGGQIIGDRWAIFAAHIRPPSNPASGTFENNAYQGIYVYMPPTATSSNASPSVANVYRVAQSRHVAGAGDLTLCLLEPTGSAPFPLSTWVSPDFGPRDDDFETVVGSYKQDAWNSTGEIVQWLRHSAGPSAPASSHRFDGVIGTTGGFSSSATYSRDGLSWEFVSNISTGTLREPNVWSNLLAKASEMAGGTVSLPRPALTVGTADTALSTSSGNWFTSADWSGGVPTSTSNTRIDAGQTATLGGSNGAAGLLLVGYTGDGTLNIGTQSGSALAVASLVLGAEKVGTTSSVGRVNLSAGSVNANWEVVGYRGLGTFTQTGGTHTVTTKLMIGKEIGSYGVYYMLPTGAATLTVGSLTVGREGDGVFLQTGGHVHVLDRLNIGSSAPASGHYAMTGGTLQVDGTIRLGPYDGSTTTGGVASFTQAGGVVSSNALQINTGVFKQASGTGTHGSVVVNSGTLLIEAGSFSCPNGLSVGSQGLVSGPASGTAALNLGGITDLSGGVANPLGLAVTTYADSLLILPSNSSPGHPFASLSVAGLTHYDGATLSIGSTSVVRGVGALRDPIVAAGSLIASSGGGINLLSGIQMSGASVVKLGSGSLNVLTGSVSLGGATFEGSGVIVGTGFSHSSGVVSSGFLSVRAGTFDQSGGISTYGRVELGYGVAGTLSGGAMSAGSIETGTLVGSFNLSGGTLTVTDHFLSRSAFTHTAGAGSISSLVHDLNDGTFGIGSFSLGTTSVSGGTLTVNRLRQAGLHLSGSAVVYLDPEQESSVHPKVGALTLSGGSSPTATLDIGAEKLVVDYTGATPYADLVTATAHGRNGGSAGTWSGTGITSAIAFGTASNKYSVAVVEASDLSLTTYGGITLDSDAVLVALVLSGDANLDGSVNIDDLEVLAPGFGSGVDGWHQGDFNYDGICDIDDLGLLAVNFGEMSEYNRPFAVPEPSSLLMLLFLRPRRQR